VVCVPNVVIVVGTGSVSRAVCSAIASHGAGIDLVFVLGGSHARVATVCNESDLVAGAARTRCRFRTGPPEWAMDHQRLSRWLGVIDPIGVVVASSDHAPSALWGASDAWTQFLARAGFGVTVALQAVHALAMGRAMAGAGGDGILINLCFPDAVNPLLEAALPSRCWGAGNVMTIEASWRAELGPGAAEDLALVGSHAALHDGAYVRGWLRGEEIRVTGGGPVCSLPPEAHRASLGVQVMALLRSIVTGERLDVSMPGAAGLAGGRPVTVSEGRVSLRAAGAMSDGDVEAFLATGLAADGISSATHEGVRFGDTARWLLEDHEPLRPYAQGIAVEDVDRAAEAFRAVRASLRSAD
jgi:hypothetical protein